MRKREREGCKPAHGETFSFVSLEEKATFRGWDAARGLERLPHRFLSRGVGRSVMSRGNQGAVSKKGGFGECTLVPFFWYWATSECTLAPAFSTGEHPNVPLLRFFRCATDHANCENGMPTNKSYWKFSGPCPLARELVYGGGTRLKKMFSSVLSCAVDLRIFSIDGGAPTSTQRPRQPPDNATNVASSRATKIPQKTHENQPRARRCFERNDSEPRKSHDNSTKSPRKPKSPARRALQLKLSKRCSFKARLRRTANLPQIEPAGTEIWIDVRIHTAHVDQPNWKGPSRRRAAKMQGILLDHKLLPAVFVLFGITFPVR